LLQRWQALLHTEAVLEGTALAHGDEIHSRSPSGGQDGEDTPSSDSESLDLDHKDRSEKLRCVRGEEDDSVGRETGRTKLLRELSRPLTPLQEAGAASSALHEGAAAASSKQGTKGSTAAVSVSVRSASPGIASHGGTSGWYPGYPPRSLPDSASARYERRSAH